MHRSGVVPAEAAADLHLVEKAPAAPEAPAGGEQATVLIPLSEAHAQWLGE